jgi:hypothetical protein
VDTAASRCGYRWRVRPHWTRSSRCCHCCARKAEAVEQALARGAWRAAGGFPFVLDLCRAARPVAVARGGPSRATSIGVVYLLLPLVSGKVDWCSIKFVVSLSCEVTNKDMRHCHSCEDVDLLQSKDGPMCRCMLKNYVICTPHNSMFYAVSDFLDLNANSPLNRRDGSIVSYKTHFKARYQLSLYSFIFSLLYLLSCRIILLCILFVYTFTRRGLNFFYEDQPLLFATKLFKARNFLHNCHYIKEKGFFLTRMIVVSAF